MPIPSGTHTDWIWPFSLIPRTSNAIPSGTPPRIVASGNLTSNPDVPNPGAWAITWSAYGPCLTYTTPGGLLLRLGTARYDYVDQYYTFPTAALKQLAP